MKRLRSILACGAAAAIVAAGASSAIADNVVLGDSLGTTGDMSLGTIACGQAQPVSLTAWIKRTGGENKNVFANGAEVTLAVSSASSTITVPTAGPVITLPNNWDAYGNTNTSSVAKFGVSVLSTTAGAGSATVEVAATGASAVPDKTPITERSTPVTLSWTTGPCATNKAPSAPGAPTASANPTQGGFTLSWAPSSDPENDAFTYTLEGKDSSGMDWTNIDDSISGTSYTFDAGAPAEGTWTYRVKAVETSTSQALPSDWSGTSAPVVVDRTDPNAPIASAGDPAYASGGKEWWKNSATVTFTGNGDPTLPDGSDGSGVSSVTDPQSFSTQGQFTASGTATDAAGNESAETVFSGYLDTEAPAVSLSCPGTVVQGSTSSATWVATDEGGSGVAGDDTGSVTIDTSAIGSHSASLPAGTVQDNVGHDSAATTCDYNVIYDFTGFFRPVIDGLNVVKAGSAVPIKFSLHGDQGLDIIKAGSPTFTVTGTSGVKTVTSGQSSLSYDPITDQYTYVWKTDKAWAGKSGTFTLDLIDGTSHSASFSFTK